MTMRPVQPPPLPTNNWEKKKKKKRKARQHSAVGSADHCVSAALHCVSAGQLDHLTYVTSQHIWINHTRHHEVNGREKKNAYRLSTRPRRCRG